MTTGKPKGAILTHANLVADLSAYRYIYRQVCIRHFANSTGLFPSVYQKTLASVLIAAVKKIPKVVSCWDTQHGTHILHHQEKASFHRNRNKLVDIVH